MRKRQIFMFLIAIWLAIIIPACHQSVQLTVNEENPVIVDPPRVNMTVFTNWQEIQLTYTIRWLDGYEPLFDEVKPENMSFAPFELDPAKSHKLELRNKRKYKKENYIDAIYYIRHIGEKKGDIPISEQTFQYTKEEAGKPIEGSEAHDVKAPGILLRYDSVLTKNADDIIDRVDFGSFKRQEYLYDGAIGGTVVIMCVILFLLFRKPVVYAARKTRKIKVASAGQAINEPEERLIPKEARRRFSNILNRLLIDVKTEPSPIKTRKAVGCLCNELRRLLLAYNLDLLESDTPKQIKAKILKIEPDGRLKNLLNSLSLTLYANENIWYTKPEDNILNLENHIKSLMREANELRPTRILRYNFLERKRKLTAWLTRWFTGFVKLFRRTK